MSNSSNAVNNIINRQKCKHLNTHKEYIGSMATGEYICQECGETFTKKERP